MRSRGIVSHVYLGSPVTMHDGGSSGHHFVLQYIVHLLPAKSEGSGLLPLSVDCFSPVVAFWGSGIGHSGARTMFILCKITLSSMGFCIAFQHFLFRMPRVMEAKVPLAGA